MANVERAAGPTVKIRELYRGYFDSTLNTDNAWSEGLVLHVVVPGVRLEASSVSCAKIENHSEPASRS